MIEAPDLMDRHDLGAMTVFPDQATAVADAEGRAEEDPAAISYLKEPQWTIGFATAIVQEAELRRGIRVPAIIEPLTGGDAIVGAPADGRFMAGTLLSVGDRVSPGQELGRIQPRLGEAGADRATLVAAEAEAQASLDATASDLARAERLLAERAVPARRVEEAQRASKVAQARLVAAQARLAQRDETLTTGGGSASGNSFVLRAPIAGRLAAVFAALGASYDEGCAAFQNCPYRPRGAAGARAGVRCAAAGRGHRDRARDTGSARSARRGGRPHARRGRDRPSHEGVARAV